MFSYWDLLQKRLLFILVHGPIQPVIIGIPLYLPFVWGSAGVFIGNLTYKMSK